MVILNPQGKPIQDPRAGEFKLIQEFSVRVRELYGNMTGEKEQFDPMRYAQWLSGCCSMLIQEVARQVNPHHARILYNQFRNGTDQAMNRFWQMIKEKPNAPTKP